MDRVELGIKLDQINKLREKGEYVDAARVCDTIDWRKVKKWSELSVAQEVYEKADRPKDSRNICVYAYNRSLGGKRLLFKLTELSIAINDLDEADDLYKEFVGAAPRDLERYVLLYKLNKARGVGTGKLIDILEEYKQNELEEQYEYELAELYAKAGRTDDCIRECDDLILWFNEGEYVEKALRLKAQYAELTKSQQAKLKMMEELRAAEREDQSDFPVYASEPELSASSAAKDGAPYAGGAAEEEYSVPEKDYSIYDTQNVQAELARSMAAILEGIRQTEPSVREQPEISKPYAVPDDLTGAPKAYAVPDDLTGAPKADTVPDGFSENTLKTPAKEPYRETERTKPLPLEEPAISPVESLDGETAYAPELLPDVSDVVRVDEPTKEIRINTHHWKRYKSYMVEEEEAPKPQFAEAQGGQSGYLIERSELEAESITDPEFIIEDMETIVEEPTESAPAAEEIITAEEPAAEEAAAEEPSVGEPTEAAPATEEIAKAEPTEEKPVGEPDSPEEVPIAVLEEIPMNEADDGIIEGQIDLLAWLGGGSQSTEPESKAEEQAGALSGPEEAAEEIESEKAAEAAKETEPEAAKETQPETESQAESQSEAQTQPEEVLPVIEEQKDETEVDKSVEEVMDEMTRKLMEEVAQDMEEREKQRTPSSIREEEYIATAEEPEETAAKQREEDKAKDGDPEEYLAEAMAEAAVAIAQEMPKMIGASGETKEQKAPEAERNDFILKDVERKYLRQYLFMDGIEAQAAQIINGKKREVSDGTSARGNIVVLGKSNTNKKFAIDLFKAIHAEDGAYSLKIARTTAAIINRNGIKASADKIKGMTLIIENAGQLTKASIDELYGFMTGDTQSMLVIMTGEDYAVKRLLAENPRFGELFDYTVEIRQCTVNEFVAMAKEYSRVKGYLITDRALLKLYLMVDALASQEDGAELEGVRRIVDKAIEHSRKKPKKSGALIRLKEKDFVE